ncbi:DUF1707 domain-containing protein [Streptomyces sp. p1417]|uniref:DUF1707 domain-containing protein n=1 Tax=Streptomyces typhae TaxID=2681492 RepID=A0A6L6WMN9_9ACTN|nr:DUF1707 domain-containing protein [Streptomyces typhae]
MDLEKRSQTPSRPSGRLRASDADRDRTADILADALAAGRLDPQEHSERLDGVYRAKTLADLEPFVEDLPDPDEKADRGSPGAASGFEKATSRPSPGAVPDTADEKLYGVFGDAVRRGRWRVARRTHAYALFGDVLIDLSEAVFEHRQVVIKGFALFGDVRIRVPENISLRGRGSGVFGTFEVDMLDAEDQEAPVVFVEGLAVCGDVRARPKYGKIIRDLRGYLRKRLEG